MSKEFKVGDKVVKWDKSFGPSRDIITEVTKVYDKTGNVEICGDYAKYSQKGVQCNAYPNTFIRHVHEKDEQRIELTKKVSKCLVNLRNDPSLLTDEIVGLLESFIEKVGAENAT